MAAAAAEEERRLFREQRRAQAGGGAPVSDPGAEPAKQEWYALKVRTRAGRHLQLTGTAKLTLPGATLHLHL